MIFWLRDDIITEDSPMYLHGWLGISRLGIA
jgi:hypothetical protein